MQVSRFDGGISNRVDASLILSNEAVTYTNIDNTSLILKPSKNATLTATIVGGYFYNFADTWLSSTEERSYVEYKNSLYFTEAGKYVRKFNGSRELNLGIIAPTDKLVATQADPVATEKISASASTLQYVYTYYNSEDGTESAPSPISDELALAADKVVDLTGFIVSTDIQVDQFRIYRIGDGTTTMTLVKTVSNAAGTVRDDILTLDLPGTILDSYTNQAPLLGLQYLTEAYGIMFAALGDKLYFSRIGIPDAWPTANYIDTPRTITGILPVPSGLLVFSSNRTDILVGTSVADFRLLPVSKEQGSISHLSGKEVKSIPVFISTEGICSYSSGGIQVMSKDKLGLLTLDVVNTAVIDETYYICLVDGTILAMDLRFGIAFKKYNSSVFANILVHNSTLYARIGDKLATMFTNDNANLTYLSPRFTEEAHSVTKLYNHIYIRSDGDFTLTVYIDDVLVHTEVLTGTAKVHDVTPPQEKQRGSSIQLGFTGTGKVYEYEYKVVGRQNGR